ncbi:MAG: hypothetical protein ACKO6B_03480 [Planctomycetia bacterium]
MWGLSHAIRATDAGMDVLHRVYERLIRWVFSSRRWRLFLWPVWGHGFDVQGLRDKTSPRRWRWATLTPRGLVTGLGVASFVGALGLAPLVGSEFMPEVDQGYTQLALRMPVGSSLERTDA